MIKVDIDRNATKALIAALTPLLEGHPNRMVLERAITQLKWLEERFQLLTDLETLAETLGLEPDDLDETVNETMGDFSATVTNGGLEAQIAFLLEQGWSGHDIEQSFQEISQDQT